MHHLTKSREKHRCVGLKVDIEMLKYLLYAKYKTSHHKGREAAPEVPVVSVWAY